MVRNVATPPSTSVRTVVRLSARRKRRSRKPPDGAGEGSVCVAAVMARRYPRTRTRPFGPAEELWGVGSD